MKSRIFYPLLAFILVFIFHMAYSVWRASQILQQWAQPENLSLSLLYFKQQHYFLSFSYALAGAFTVYAFLKLLYNRKSGVAGAGLIGGITLTAILYTAGCFLLGCCGSPMLAVYLSLFGSSFLGFTKPLIAAITTISVLIGYFWIERKSKTCCEDYTLGQTAD